MPLTVHHEITLSPSLTWLVVAGLLVVGGLIVAGSFHRRVLKTERHVWDLRSGVESRPKEPRP